MSKKFIIHLPPDVLSTDPVNPDTLHKQEEKCADAGPRLDRLDAQLLHPSEGRAQRWQLLYEAVSEVGNFLVISIYKSLLVAVIDLR